MRQPGGFRVLLPALVLVSLLLAGCARGINYQALDQHMTMGDCEAALGLLKEKGKSYGKNQRLIYLMDVAAVALYCEEHELSNEYLHEAEQLAEDLWTKSITREAAAFLLNDYTRPYAGEDFERAFLNVYSALNYVLVDDYEEALVECRRLNNKLVEINEKYEEKKNAYKEDAFGRYLSGLIYEAEDMGSLGNIDSALIDYRKALDAYRDYEEHYRTSLPRVFVEDYLRVAEAAGRLEEAREHLGYADDVRWVSHGEARTMGRIVLIHLNGTAPVKTEDKVIIPTGSGPVTVAFPRFEARTPLCRGTELVVTSEESEVRSPAELVEDVTGIALRNLQDRMGRIVLKTAARVAAKQVAIHAAASTATDKDTQELIKVVFNLVNVLVERADTRSWRTLPAEISLARVFVPEGTHTLRARFCGRTIPLERPVTLRAGQTRFVLLETIY
jgi:hypothetical protein